MDDNLDLARENFAISHTLLRMKIEDMLEKVIKMENKLKQEIRSSVSTVDFFYADPDAQPPSAKRLRIE